jgi:DNA/RNA non-specific endonuclease
MSSRPVSGVPQRPIVEKISTDRVDQYLPYEPPSQRALNGAAVYIVDQRNRPLKAEGWMFGQGAPRTSAQRDLTGAGAPYHGLRAGHLLPAARGGSGDWYNLVPITFEVNNSQAASIESFIAAHVRNQAQIFLQVYVRYTGQNRIPDELTYYVYGIAANGAARLMEKRQIGGARPIYWS